MEWLPAILSWVEVTPFFNFYLPDLQKNHFVMLTSYQQLRMLKRQ